MYVKSSTFSIEEFIKQRSSGKLEIEALKAYFELEPDIRQEVIKEFIRSRIGTSRDEFSKITVKKAESAPVSTAIERIRREHVTVPAFMPIDSDDTLDEYDILHHIFAKPNHHVWPRQLSSLEFLSI